MGPNFSTNGWSCAAYRESVRGRIGQVIRNHKISASAVGFQRPETRRMGLGIAPRLARDGGGGLRYPLHRPC
ncbi:MAG: hypothetical protein CVT85_03970 [Alphaproteobacteria bacterium HGW-Alphaproteobacteria-7]|nr:MAG: hypothetical protein CVT85_03970 [Alphaproteobacteria bacterium HGW-Alphaproteobacteria-7]